jgi:TPR repeat protein
MPQNSEQNDESKPRATPEGSRREVEADLPSPVWISANESVHRIARGTSTRAIWRHRLKEKGAETTLAAHFARIVREEPPQGWVHPLAAGAEEQDFVYDTPAINGQPLTAEASTKTLVDLAVQAVQAVRSAAAKPEWRLRPQAVGAWMIHSAFHPAPSLVFTSLVPVPENEIWEHEAANGLEEVFAHIFALVGRPPMLAEAMTEKPPSEFAQWLDHLESSLKAERSEQSAFAAVSTISRHPSRFPLATQFLRPLTNPMHWVTKSRPTLAKNDGRNTRLDKVLWIAAGLSLIIAAIVFIAPSPVRRFLSTEVAETLGADDAFPTSAMHWTVSRRAKPREETSPPQPVAAPSTAAQAEIAFRGSLEHPGAIQPIFVTAMQLLRLQPDHAEARATLDKLLTERVNALLRNSASEPGAIEEELAVSWEELTKLGFPDAGILAALQMLDGDPVTAARFVQELAKNGRPAPLILLGQLYARGAGVPIDRAKALSLFRKAAKQGDAGALYLVGECLFFGKGTAQNPKEAVAFLRQSADKNDSRAMDLLGNCHVKGLGVAKDPALAAKWFRTAIEQGNIRSLANLAVLELERTVPSADPAEPIRLLTRGAEAGSPHGTYLLGRCYEEGLGGVKTDPALALNYYRKAATLGHRLAIQWCEEHKTTPVSS